MPTRIEHEVERLAAEVAAMRQQLAAHPIDYARPTAAGGGMRYGVIRGYTLATDTFVDVTIARRKDTDPFWELAADESVEVWTEPGTWAEDYGLWVWAGAGASFPHDAGTRSGELVVLLPILRAGGKWTILHHSRLPQVDPTLAAGLPQTDCALSTAGSTVVVI